MEKEKNELQISGLNNLINNISEIINFKDKEALSKYIRLCIENTINKSKIREKDNQFKIQKNSFSIKNNNISFSIKSAGDASFTLGFKHEYYKGFESKNKNITEYNESIKLIKKKRLSFVLVSEKKGNSSKIKIVSNENRINIEELVQD